MFHIHLSQQFEQLRHRFHGRLTDRSECFRRLDAEPEVWMRQGLLQGLHGWCSTSAEEDQTLAGSVTSVEAGRIEQLDQRCHGSVLAASQGHRRSLAHDGRPTAQALDELVITERIVKAVAVFVAPAAPVDDE